MVLVQQEQTNFNEEDMLEEAYNTYLQTCKEICAKEGITIEELRKRDAQRWISLLTQ